MYKIRYFYVIKSHISNLRYEHFLCKKKKVKKERKNIYELIKVLLKTGQQKYN